MILVAPTLRMGPKRWRLPLPHERPLFSFLGRPRHGLIYEVVVQHFWALMLLHMIATCTTATPYHFFFSFLIYLICYNRPHRIRFFDSRDQTPPIDSVGGSCLWCCWPHPISRTSRFTSRRNSWPSYFPSWRNFRSFRFIIWRSRCSHWFPSLDNVDNFESWWNFLLFGLLL